MIREYKKESGITLIALIVTIIIMLLISGVAISTGISTKRRAVYFGVIAELKTMQSEINSLYDEYRNGNNEILNYGAEVTGNLVDSENKKVLDLEESAFSSLDIDEEDRSGYRYFSSQYISNTLKISGIDRDFLINIQNRSVILTKGVKYGNNVYYSLSQVKDGGYNVEFAGDEVIIQEEEEEEGIAEAPIVSGKEMIPVVWNKGTLSWVKADVVWDEGSHNWIQNESSEYKWYDYSKKSKKWANIVLVEKEGISTREYYKQCQAGTEIKMDDILCMYVWIPRFENKNTYYTNNTYSRKSNSTTRYVNSDVKFISKDVQADEGYEINRAFSYVDGSSNIVNLEGFWIGKFEASNYTSVKEDDNIGLNYGRPKSLDKVEDVSNPLENYIKIKPGLTSWRYTAISTTSNVENVSHILPIIAQDTEDVYGLDSKAEIGLSTLQMWNAVSYLAQSDYGNKVDAANPTIYGNFYYQGDSSDSVGYYTTLTGIVSSKDANDFSEDEDAHGQIDRLITVKKDVNNGHIIINDKYNYYEYWTEIGQKGSTSSNVYGVYDMIGCASEYTVDMPDNFYGRDGVLDLTANFYYNGGAFYQYTGSSREYTNLLYKSTVSNLSTALRANSFRTGIFIKH